MMVCANISGFFVGKSVGHITAKNYVNTLVDQAHPIVNTLFPNVDGVFQVDIGLVHTSYRIQD